jgi:acyl dehydratase
MQSEFQFIGKYDLLNAEIGHEIPPTEMIITEEMVERYTWANDDYNPWYLKDSPFDGTIAPPTFLAYETDIMFINHFILPEGKGIWAKQEFEFIKPLKIGKKIKISGKITDKIYKRGRDHISFEYIVAEDDGTEVVCMRTVLAFPLIARN